MMTEREAGASCGVVKKRDGSEEVVVAGGVCEGWLDNVEIFSLEESQWRLGME
jgi:hypothetical protein